MTFDELADQLLKDTEKIDAVTNTFVVYAPLQVPVAGAIQEVLKNLIQAKLWTLHAAGVLQGESAKQRDTQAKEEKIGVTAVGQNSDKNDTKN